LLFSGDLGRKGLPILRDPEIVEDVDFLLMESTYGNRVHEGVDEARSVLLKAARDTCDRKGKLIIPAFSVGRTQEVVYRLNQLWEEGELPPIDVFVDSPLAVNITDVFRLHPECYDEEMREALLTESDHDPLGFRNLRYVRSVDGSKRLNTLEDPFAVISASGMCEAGRILHHLRNSIEDPATTILFTGYQAPGTRGRRLLDGEDTVEIFGKNHKVAARVRRAESYSAHADREELLWWAGRIRKEGDLKRVLLVHGEEEALVALAEGLRDSGIPDVAIPLRGHVIEL
jgi:metallo-beta-lactamase family protein